MAGTSLLALLDDIANILDDVATLTKVATKKTAGVLGDDLALNAQQVTGVHADRELQVVFAVAKGSLRNKAILIPAALLISALVPRLITPLLMAGGAFLCFEGFEKIAHRFLHDAREDEAAHAELLAKAADPAVDLVAAEQAKIKGAVRTDFILSAEIITIALGTVADQTLAMQTAVLTGIGLGMTVGVYGLVAGIVKLDDLGVSLSQGPAASSGFNRAVGRAILAAAPYLMKALSIAGTAAMFLVGGSILTHGIAPLHHWIEALAHRPAGSLLAMLADAAVGIATGAAALLVVTAVQKLRRSKA